MAGLVARVLVKTKDGKTHDFSTDKAWKSTLTPALKWEQAKFDDGNWEAAHEFGVFGKTAPWNNLAKFSDKPATGTWDPAATKSVNIESTFIPQPPAGPWAFELKDGDRVVFLGATFVEREQQYGYIELALTSRWPDRHITFRNLGWSGDTVFGEARARFGDQREGFNHLNRFLRGAQPTVVMIAYGFNESFDGPAGLDRFKQGLDNLLKTVEPTGARIALISPHKHENLGAPLPDATKNNDNLALYTAALRQVAQERGYPFFNLFNIYDCTRSAVTEQITDDGQASRTVAAQRLNITDNGMHLTGLGYWHVAGQMLDRAKLAESNWLVEIGGDGKVKEAAGTRVTDVEASADSIRFTALDATLPPPLMSVPRSPNKGALPDSSESRIWRRSMGLRIEGLKPGRYEVRIDGQRVAVADEKKLASWLPLPDAPQFAQAEELRQAIIRKNELFFHSWRPANETYIYLFRKHEQGNNAVEMPQFIPLVEAEEKRIAQLRKPKARVYEVVPVK
jgi:lysophospholipase L1-like esterase